MSDQARSGDDPMTVVRDDGFLVGTPLFGPFGWSDELAETLSPWMLGDRHGGLTEFAGVPNSIATQAAEQAVERTDGKLNLGRITALGALCGGGPVVAGIRVHSDRNDERLEFTAVHVDVTGWDEDAVVRQLEVLTAARADAFVEDGDGQRRIVAS